MQRYATWTVDSPMALREVINTWKEQGAEWTGGNGFIRHDSDHCAIAKGRWEMPDFMLTYSEVRHDSGKYEARISEYCE